GYGIAEHGEGENGKGRRRLHRFKVRLNLVKMIVGFGNGRLGQSGQNPRRIVISATNTLRWSESFDGVERPRIARHRLNVDNHAHDHDFMELAVMLGGTARHLSDRGEAIIGKGDAVLLRPGTWHAYLECRDLDVINFCFPLTLARDGWRHLLAEDV